MESVGLILIIPFGISFVLLFFVCCFADELKRICSLPSQIPQSYLGSPVFRSRERTGNVNATAHSRAETYQLISSTPDPNFVTGSPGYDSTVERETRLQVDGNSDPMMSPPPVQSAAPKRDTCTQPVEVSVHVTNSTDKSPDALTMG